MGRYKLVFFVIFLAIILSLGVSYSFFLADYNSSTQVIETGEVYVTVTGNNTINITDIVPIQDAEINTLAHRYSFTIHGKSNSEDDLVYAIKLVNGNDISSKTRISDEYVYVSLKETTSSNNYLLSGERISDLRGDSDVLFSDNIPSNTNSDITRTYELLIWISGDISNTTNLYANFNIEVEADFDLGILGENKYLINKVINGSYMDNVSSPYVSSNSGINFSQFSSNTNGKGIYQLHTTSSNYYPVYYYRGDVDNNNVIFANYCWKIVRTTDSGGVKLVYNGPTSYSITPLNSSSYTVVTNISTPHFSGYSDISNAFTFNSSTNEWQVTSQENYNLEFSFKVATNSKYRLIIDGTPSDYYTWGNLLIYKNNVIISGIEVSNDEKVKMTYTFDSLSSSDVIKIAYLTSADGSHPISLNIKMGLRSNGVICDNGSNESVIQSSNDYNNYDYNDSAVKLFSFVGYMYNNNYASNTITIDNFNGLAGSSVTWDGETYHLVNTSNSIDDTHKYVCDNYTDTCSNLWYIFYHIYSYYNYIILNNGKNVEDAINDMMVNINDSTAKLVIDNCYQTTFNDSSYTSELEDTIYCNDRSVSVLGGWDSISGSLTEKLYFAPDSRIMDTEVPSLACSRNDSFTVKESSVGNGALKYPVALLTLDEAMLAGETYYYDSDTGVTLTNGSFYLFNNNSQLLMTPRYLFIDTPEVFYYRTGVIRPVISLRADTIYYFGDGTSSNPYNLDGAI